MYAKGTSVSVERSRMEIEKIIKKYNASQFIYGDEVGCAMVGFKMNERFIRFRLPLARADRRRWVSATNKYIGEDLSEEKAAQRNRERWRALVLVLKAKLEAVASGISDFETEFLGTIMVPGGKTVADVMKPQLEETYKTGRGTLALMPGMGE